MSHESPVLSRRSFERRPWGTGCGARLSGGPRERSRVRGGERGGRPDGAPVAIGGQRGRPPWHGVCARAAANERVGAADRRRAVLDGAPHW
jgi:hypothetical protein